MNFGAFNFTAEANTKILLTIVGTYFSENSGTNTSSEIMLQGVVAVRQSSANVNVATHLIHLRVIQLIKDGMAADLAINTAEDELILAFSELLAAPTSSLDFSDLVVINKLGNTLSVEGNAWLLALSSLLEKTAIEQSMDSENIVATLSHLANNSTSSSATAALDAGFSETNLLVNGVDEVDSIKFKGEYLFIANGSYIQVIDTHSSSDTLAPAEIVASINIDAKPDNNFYSSGLYLYEGESGNVLADIRNTYSYGIGGEFVDAIADSFFAPWPWDGTTVLDFFNIDNPASIQKSSQLTLKGTYIDSRRIANKLYVITRFTPSVDGLVPFAESTADIEKNRAIIDGLDISDLLPKLSFDNGNTVNLVATDACFLHSINTASDQINYPTITTITAIDMNDPTSFQSLCLTDGISGIHVAKESIYLAAVKYSSGIADEYFSETTIHKLALSASGISYVGSGSVDGAFWGDPKFLMGEHNGNLTLITTLDHPDQDPRFSHQLSILGESSEASYWNNWHIFQTIQRLRP